MYTDLLVNKISFETKYLVSLKSEGYVIRFPTELRCMFAIAS